ncbi:hypothetical protein [Nonomuraea terrae]|uniref:hypothetical protein n=1 Tax=Nonomuraea terrae TaxID=2530383 RepID=UPI001404D7FC|nr:hypothetical protein [Nonomuraea terrae]
MATLCDNESPEPATEPDPPNAEIVARLKARDRSGGPSAADIVRAVHEGSR